MDEFDENWERERMQETLGALRERFGDPPDADDRATYIMREDAAELGLTLARSSQDTSKHVFLVSSAVMAKLLGLDQGT